LRHQNQCGKKLVHVITFENCCKEALVTVYPTEIKLAILGMAAAHETDIFRVISDAVLASKERWVGDTQPIV
jgi:hypothetical protein